MCYGKDTYNKFNNYILREWRPLKNPSEVWTDFGTRHVELKSRVLEKRFLKDSSGTLQSLNKKALQLKPNRESKHNLFSMRING